MPGHERATRGLPGPALDHPPGAPMPAFLSGAHVSGDGTGAAIWQLAVAQTLVYAGLYYVFPPLLPVWEADLGWSRATLATALTASMVAWALFAPVVGRLIDAGRGAAALGGGMACGGLVLAALPLAASSGSFTALWVLIGLALGASTYDPCFALVARTRGPEARRAITRITLVAGFAGTLAFPSAHALAAAAGWRATVVVFGLTVTLIAAPLAFLGARHLERAASVPAGRAEAGPVPERLLARPPFWLLGIAFSAIAMSHSIVIAHLLPLLAGRGFGATEAVVAISTLGPMQVGGRLLMLAVERRASNRVLTASCLAGLTCAAAALLAGPAPLVALFVALQGGSMGMLSIMKPMVSRDLLGPHGLGAAIGALALPSLLAAAAGPLAGALLWHRGGDRLVCAALLALALTGLAGFVAAAALAGRVEPTPGSSGSR